METSRAIYPFALALSNIALGWLLYRPLGSVLGVPLVGVGILVILTRVGSAVRDRRSIPGLSA